MTWIRSRLGINVGVSIVEQASQAVLQLVTGIVVIKNLATSEYGEVGVASGVLLLLAFLNVSEDAAILRFFSKEHQSERWYRIPSFTLIAITKFCFLFFFAFLLYCVADIRNGYIYFAVFLSIFGPGLFGPFFAFLIAELRQWELSLLRLGRLCLRLVVLVVGIENFSAETYFFAELSSWIFLLVASFMLASRDNRSWVVSRAVIRENLTLMKSASWHAHIVGSISGIVYKIDPFILAFFVSREEVGLYNVVLVSTNVANVLPGALFQHNAMELTRVGRSGIRRVTRDFVRLGCILNAVVLLGFLLFGPFYLGFLLEEAYAPSLWYTQMAIVIGLLFFKTFANPLVNVVVVYGDLRKLVWRVSIPTLILATVIYAGAGCGANLLAMGVANALIYLIWGMFILFLVKKPK